MPSQMGPLCQEQQKIHTHVKTAPYEGQSITKKRALRNKWDNVTQCFCLESDSTNVTSSSPVLTIFGKNQTAAKQLLEVSDFNIAAIVNLHLFGRNVNWLAAV
eukprot:TRINITY_DN1199_c1_g1_i6.p3 TRINITY_DN1199_c1_g1~~TRINITY_DN1199_c1_g1_i6.p3  ORF type:complete len:103 (-),score=13.44 TRINITY_DN1199_c1_g1_i6:119-427(-)